MQQNILESSVIYRSVSISRHLIGTIETMTHAAKKATNQYRDDVIFQYKKSKSVPILLPGQNFFTGTKLFHWDKTY